MQMKIWKYRFFLPIDEKLILNGVTTEELRSIVYVGSDESIPLELCCAVGSNKESLKPYKIFLVVILIDRLLVRTLMMNLNLHQCLEDIKES